MLEFTIRLADLRAPSWAWTAGQWRTGESWVTPLVNPSIESFRVETGDRSSLVIVRERDLTGRLLPVPRTRADALEWPGDHVTLELTPDGVTVHAGRLGTVPLLLTIDDGVAVGSWRLPMLKGRFEPAKLIDVAVARALLRYPVYSSATLFDGMHRLTERATARMDGHGVRVTYPEPAEHVLAARDIGKTDLVAAFEEVLAYVVARLPAPAGRVAAELSGGADSANVALSAAAIYGTLRTLGLVVDGDVGRLQARRRSDLVRQLGAHDTAIPAADFPPFTPRVARSRRLPHDPEATFYLEAFNALRDAAADKGVSLVHSGLGGDELCALHPHEREPEPDPTMAALPSWAGPLVRAVAEDLDADAAPVSAVPIPTLNAFAVQNPAYLDAGIWPVAPLAHPLVGRFCEQLPIEYRRGKHLLRERLRRSGLTERVAAPAQPENFRSLMDQGMREYGVAHLRAMLAESILVDSGYVDGQALREATDELESTGGYESRLFDTIALEVGLRSLQ